MSTTALAFIAADLVAVSVLVLALYVPRHTRKDLMAAYIGVNIGVLAVTALLSTSSVGAGLGLGLFGVLSIIRLRSTELSQHEVAYFFASLALGLLGGIQTAPLALTVALMALVVLSLAVADAPALLRRNRHQLVMIDRAIADEHALAAHLEELLGARVRSFEVQRLDMVNDTTLVDVRYVLHRAGATADRSTDRTEHAQPARPHAVAPLPASIAPVDGTRAARRREPVVIAR
ncbi:DUF4956 domain-containing protein [Actinomyces sp. AC-20-1]|uniref:DUF4956 domain-containing protein n=1 Tax=Actinomyces sp. AC-20-1 TaxID=2761167 RepID=UPI002019DA38|nr:DUF4956 domain-containing protein [Actinomyces sp. AC-20-1]MCL3777842.1 DUF4956 domain-containing protein [Actinomyces sp. AC-20-1]